MSEVFTGYPPFHDIPHNAKLQLDIFNKGRIPEIKCEVPQLLLDLMNKCLDAEPQNRPTAKKLKDTLHKFFEDLRNEKTKFYKQVNEIRDSDKNLNQTTPIRLNYQTHKQAIYTSRLLNYQNLHNQ
ncbi:hypothetical protein C2G38_2293910 [Gigaspora rosea]|uniref:Protein kinase domain-containing protein n=1 Tax=Gigaspora rosea TaxID=44941 RepID=A0A397TZB9_9GLOM|nr:hypothetical protein C2G38_2050564 [Gigaspora rosea]RIB01819.1 hypothetical protein C2G38_2293910 [Gigaspora rosea]